MAKIEAKRTPDDRFGNLPGYGFAPHYVEDLPGYEGLRVHYLDEGPSTAKQTFLCLHGEPSWCYLYRKMIPIFVESGARVIAPDWFGFGRSDKPVKDAVYTFNFHRTMMMEFIKRLDLKNISLVCQDWGGILGLTIPVDMPERFTRVLVMNTAIAIGEPAEKGFSDWRAFNRSQPDMNIEALIQGVTPVLSDEEAAAYAAPFPDVTYKAGVRRFPDLVMTDPEMEGVDISKRAADWWSNSWTGKSFMAVGKHDGIITPAIMERLRGVIRNCPEPMMLENAGHFVPEWGEPVAKEVLRQWGDV